MVTSKLLTTAMAVINGFNQWDIDAMLAPRAANCTQRDYPYRLDSPYRTNAEVATFFSSILPYFTNFTVTVTDTFVDEENNRVALQAFSRANSVVGPYRNEYVFTMRMTECQEKVWEIREFVDSEYYVSFFSNLTKYMDEGGPTLAELAAAR
jgi:ketosteroid isomerase-like protein